MILEELVNEQELSKNRFMNKTTEVILLVTSRPQYKIHKIHTITDIFWF